MLRAAKDFARLFGSVSSPPCFYFTFLNFLFSLLLNSHVSKSSIFFHNDTLGSNSEGSNREQAGSDGIGDWALSTNIIFPYILFLFF